MARVSELGLGLSPPAPEQPTGVHIARKWVPPRHTETSQSLRLVLHVFHDILQLIWFCAELTLLLKPAAADIRADCTYKLGCRS